jgi:hypothetical protein
MSAPRVVYLSQPTRRLLWFAAAGGLATLTAYVVADPARAWTSLLVAAFTLLTVSLGALVFLALHHVGASGWSTAIKRVAEGLTGWLPLGACAMLAVLGGVPTLYHWVHVDPIDQVLAGKRPWLNAPFFAARMVVLLGIWLLFAWLLRRASLAQDREPGERHTRRAVRLSAAFLPIFGVTFSVASFDWLMSLEPHWSSTIFALYNLAGVLTAGVAGITVAAILLHRAGHLDAFSEDHLHSLGSYLFGFATLWAYLWFSQYLLVWYANIPEETAYYLARTRQGWGFLFYLNLIAGWALPFLSLMTRRAKRSEAHMFRVALWMLGARWLDVYLMGAPAPLGVHPGIGLPEVAAVVGLGAAFVLVTARALGGAPLLARNDPYLVESLPSHEEESCAH